MSRSIDAHQIPGNDHTVEQIRIKYAKRDTVVM